jgi:hypothetical protein
MHLREIGCGVVASGSGLGTSGRLFESDNEPWCYIEGGEFLTSLVTVSFSRRTLIHGVSKLMLQHMFQERLRHLAIL